MPGFGMGNLADKLRSAIADDVIKTTVRVFEKNEHVYNWGDQDDCVYLVEQGRVKATRFSEGGKQCLLSIHGPGDVFGELCLISESRAETTTAMTVVVAREIPCLAFRSLLAHEGLSEALFGHLAGRLAEQQQMITYLVTMDCKQRLAAVLLHLGRKLGRRCPAGLRLEEKITHEELSAMVGTTRSRVGYFLKSFHEEGLIRRGHDGAVIIEEEGLSARVAAWQGQLTPRGVGATS